MHPDGTSLTLLTPDEGTGASWTPDGKHILYYAQNYIWLMDPDGSNKAQWSAAGPDLSTSRARMGTRRAGSGISERSSGGFTGLEVFRYHSKTPEEHDPWRREVVMEA